MAKTEKAVPKAEKKVVPAKVTPKKVIKKADKPTHREELAAAVPKAEKKVVPAKVAKTLPLVEAALIKIDPLVITVNVAQNPRQEYGDISSLERYIRENGADKLPAIKVRETKDGFELIHGYRRMKAIANLIKKGEHPGYIHCVKVAKGYTAKQELLDHLTDNEGKNLTPMEQAFIYQELEKAGMTQAAIRKSSGKSKNHIKWMIRLANAPEGIHKAIIDGSVSITLAIDFINKFGDKAQGRLLAAISIAKEKGEKKVDKESAEAAGFVKKHTFVNTLDRLRKTKGITKTVNKRLEKLGTIITLIQNEKDPEKLLVSLLKLIG